MGSKEEFQPLTTEDRVTVAIYRTGIVLSAVIISCLAFLPLRVSSNSGAALISPPADGLFYGLYVSVGMSVLFIHLYIGKLKRYIMTLYTVSLVCLVVLLYAGEGSVSAALVNTQFSPLLLLPLSGCLGFVTAKEAFCFRLFEGYLLAMIMPLYLLLVSAGVLTGRSAASGLVLIAVMLVIFTLRKVFMPIAYDIGDKAAYR